jgi:hypothetical protein
MKVSDPFLDTTETMKEERWRVKCERKEEEGTE